MAKNRIKIVIIVVSLILMLVFSIWAVSSYMQNSEINDNYNYWKNRIPNNNQETLEKNIAINKFNEEKESHTLRNFVYIGGILSICCFIIVLINFFLEDIKKSKQNEIIEEFKKNTPNETVERHTPECNPLRKDWKLTIVAVILIILFSTISFSILAYEENRYSFIQTNYNNLHSTYNSLQSEHNSLTGDYTELQTNYNSMQSRYNMLQTTYNNLKSSYETLYAPSTLIQNGIIHWRFNMLDGTIGEWTVPIDTYRSYIDLPEPTALLYLSNTNTGETYTVKDLGKYVQPDFFVNVISGFTDGKTDKQFVQEVVNFKNQIVIYGSGLGDFYRWPAETITEGRGQCGDTTILMASLLKAGENRAHYGLSMYIWYCDAYHMTSPQTVNHAIVEVKCSDGTDYLIETTSDAFYTYNQIFGWSFQV